MSARSYWFCREWLMSVFLVGSCTAASSAAAPDELWRARPAEAAQTAPRLSYAALDLGIGDTLSLRQAAVPAAFATRPALPFSLNALGVQEQQRGLECLTAAIYHEARSEPEEGQRSVAQVVLNRVRQPGFGPTICGVVYAGSARSTGCQFTFTCDGSLGRRRDIAAWHRARKVAEEALGGHVQAKVGRATHYHTRDVRPWWARHLRPVATVGEHIFYL